MGEMFANSFAALLDALDMEPELKAAAPAEGSSSEGVTEDHRSGSGTTSDHDGSPPVRSIMFAGILEDIEAMQREQVVKKADDAPPLLPLPDLERPAGQPDAAVLLRNAAAAFFTADDEDAAAAGPVGAGRAFHTGGGSGGVDVSGVGLASSASSSSAFFSFGFNDSTEDASPHAAAGHAKPLLPLTSGIVTAAGCGDGRAAFDDMPSLRPATEPFAAAHGTAQSAGNHTPLNPLARRWKGGTAGAGAGGSAPSAAPEAVGAAPMMMGGAGGLEIPLEMPVMEARHRAELHLKSNLNHISQGELSEETDELRRRMVAIQQVQMHAARAQLASMGGYPRYGHNHHHHNQQQQQQHSSGHDSSFGSDPDVNRVDPEMYKVRLCRNMLHSGDCHYGPHCVFAHSPSELRSRETNLDVLKRLYDACKPAVNPLKYKVIICKKFQESGVCPYDAHCVYAHGPSELRSVQQNLQAMHRIQHICNTTGATYVSRHGH